jgi:hypothetical protein
LGGDIAAADGLSTVITAVTDIQSRQEQ